MSSKRVLIVDDHHDGAESLQQLVEAWGHRVAVAHDGSAAVEIARSWSPDVVVMDINMPVLDGYGAARLLRVANDRTLLIAMTASPAVESRARARDAGFHHHYSKPLELDELKTLLNSDALHHLAPGFLMSDEPGRHVLSTG